MKRDTSASNGEKPGLGWALSAAAIILWTSAVVAAYFWAHKPFDSAIILGLGRSFLSVIVWLGMFWLAAAAGRRITGRLLGGGEPAPRLALSAGLGLGLLSLLVLGIGLAGWLQPGIAWAVVAVLALVLRRDLLTVLTDLRAIRLPPARGIFERWLAIFIGVSLLLAFLLALAPPTGWDALVYHLTGPRLFVQAGQITHSLDLPYLGFPQLGEMLFTLGMLLGGEGVAPLIHYGYGLMALVMTAALAGRVFGTDRSDPASVRWLAGALLLSVPTLLSLMTRAYVDLILLFYATAAVYVFVRWREAKLAQESDRKDGLTPGLQQEAGDPESPDVPACPMHWLWLLGALAGFCIGVKYTAAAIPLVLGLSVIWASRRDGLKAIAGRLLQLGGVVLLVSLPWLLENWLTTGNPLYPFFFPGVHWDSWRAWWYDRPGTGLLATRPWGLLTAPLEATVLGSEGLASYDATIGPLLLLSLPLLLVVWRTFSREERSKSGYLIFFLAVNYCLWLVGLARSALLLQTRLLLPVFGVAAALGSVGLQRLSIMRRPQLAVDWLVRVLVGLSLALLLFSQLVNFLQINPLPVIVGVESRDGYLSRRLGLYHTVMTELNQLPSGARVVFLWEPRSYACQVDCQPDALLDRFLHLAQLHEGAGAIAHSWREAGVTHVLLYQQGMQSIVEAGFDPVTERDLAVMDELQSQYLSPVMEWGDAYVLYRLEP